MSYSLDVNVLLYASNADAPEHERASSFMAECAAGPELLCLAWLTLASYLRMATHPRLFARPLSPDEALRNVESLLALPHVRAVGEREGFLAAYRQVTADVPTRGNLVPDAHLATVLRQHGVRRLWSRDRDFLKFPFLDVRDPLAPRDR